jgi:hypothetical protein
LAVAPSQMSGTMGVFAEFEPALIQERMRAGKRLGRCPSRTERARRAALAKRGGPACAGLRRRSESALARSSASAERLRVDATGTPAAPSTC